MYLYFGSDLYGNHSHQLQIALLNIPVLFQKLVHVVETEMVGVPFEPILHADLLHPVQQHQTHLLGNV